VGTLEAFTEFYSCAITDDKTESSMCIGTFDSLGIPIAVAKKT
jgi:hypothetical protein